MSFSSSAISAERAREKLRYAPSRPADPRESGARASEVRRTAGPSDLARRQLVLDQRGPCGLQLRDELQRALVRRAGRRVPARPVRGRRGLLLDAVGRERHQPLPQRLGPQQRLPAVLRRGEHLQHLRGRRAPLRTVDRVVVPRLDGVGDLVPGAQPQGRQLPGVCPPQPPRRLPRSLEDDALFLAPRELEQQGDLRDAVVVRRRPVEHHAPLRIDLQRLLRGRLDGHLRRLVGDDLDRTFRPLGDGAPLGVEEAEAPAPRLGQRERSGELPAPRPLRKELHRLAVDDRRRLGEVAVGPGRDVRLGPARRAQIARGPLLGARGESGVLWVLVGDGQIADDGGQLRRGRGRVASAQPRKPEREAPRRGQLEKPRRDQRTREDRQGQPGRAQRELPAHVERARLARRPHVEQREQVARDARLLGGAGQLHAREQLRRSGQEPRQRGVVPRAGALQRRPQGEDDDPCRGGEEHHRCRHTRHGRRGERTEQCSGTDGHRGAGGQQRGGAQEREAARPPPRPAEQRVDFPPGRHPLLRQRRQAGGKEPAQLGDLRCRLRQLHRTGQGCGSICGTQSPQKHRSLDNDVGLTFPPRLQTGRRTGNHSRHVCERAGVPRTSFS